MDVTQQYLDTVQHYGSSDSSHPGYLAATTHLNYASGPTIKNPVEQIVSSLPMTYNYSGSVGLFGVENLYVKVIDDSDRVSPNTFIEEESWLNQVSTTETSADMFYAKAAITDETVEDENYQIAGYNNKLWFSTSYGTYISVDIINTGIDINCVDTWIDAGLYGRNQQPHPYKRIYIPVGTYCYFGIHARNTKRMDYNVQLIVGASIVAYDAMTEDQRRLVEQS